MSLKFKHRPQSCETEGEKKERGLFKIQTAKRALVPKLYFQGQIQIFKSRLHMCTYVSYIYGIFLPVNVIAKINL